MAEAGHTIRIEIAICFKMQSLGQTCTHFSAKGTFIFRHEVVGASQDYLVFIEGAGHPVPERAQSPFYFCASFHLLYTILLFFIPGR